MKKIIIPILAFACVSLTSCEVTVGGSVDKKEIKNGFAYEEVTCKLNGTFSLSNDEIFTGTTLYTTFTGVTNATLKDDFQHVGIGIQLFDEKDELIIERDDLLDNIEQQDPKLSEFSAFYTVPENISDGTKAKFIFTLFDKYGSVSYDYERVFTVVHKQTPETIGCKIKSNLDSKSEITAKLFNGTYQYKDTPAKIDIETELVLYLNNVKGFSAVENLITINFSIKLLDSNGDQIFEQSGDFSGTTEQFENTPLNASQNFDNTIPKNLTWVVTYSDANSDKYVTVQSELNLSK